MDIALFFLCKTSYVHIGNHHLCTENNTPDATAGLEEGVTGLAFFSLEGNSHLK